MELDWNIIIQNIIVSAAVAVIFSGGTNYFLQKRNRRANILYEQGFELIDEIYFIDQKRVEASFYVTGVHNVPTSKMKQVYSDYVKHCLKFENEVKKRSVFLSKKINARLGEYFFYLKEVENAIEKNLEGKVYIINFNKKADEACEQIVSLIKKHS